MNVFNKISDWVDADHITLRNASIGNPKFGKSTYGRLLTEIYTMKKYPLTYVDPAGICAAVRTVRDDIVIIGGENGDVALDEVDRVLPVLLDGGINFILDMFELDDEYNKEITGELFDYFFQWHKQTRQVRKYVLDECDYYIPQYHFDRTCKANITRCVSKGRMFGMGFDFITQNFTMIDKTILKMVDNTLIFNLSDPIDMKRVGDLVGERLDSKIKHLGVGKCLLYNKKDKLTYTVDKPESESAGSTPKLGETFEPLHIKPLNAELTELLEL